MKITQLSGCIALSNEQINDFEEFRPHYGIHSFTNYRQFNSNCSLPDATISVLSNWIEHGDDEAGLALVS